MNKQDWDGDWFLRRKLEKYKVRFVLVSLFLIGLAIHFLASQASSLQSSPFGMIPWRFYTKVADAFVVAALVGVTYEWYAKEIRQSQLRGMLKEEVGEIEVSSEQLKSELFDDISDTYDTIFTIRDFGFKDAFETRGPKQKEVYKDRLDKASESIDIIGYGLQTFREDFRDQFEGWTSEVEVRVLLIDPEYPTHEHSFAKQRDEEEGSRQGKIEKDVKEFIHDTNDLIKSENNFNVRLYTCLPSVTIFKIDNGLFWGPYTVGDQSRNMPVFLVASNSYLYGYFEEHFENIWESDNLSREIPQEWLR